MPGTSKVAPLNAHREKQSITGDFDAVGKFYEAIWAIHAEANDILGRKNFDAETAGLRDSAAGQVGA